MHTTLPTSQRLRIAVLGTGLMGAPMARRLCKAGHAVHVWNRTPSKAEALQAHGATAHMSPRNACAQADVVLCMLIDGEATRQVLLELGDDSAVHGMRPGALVVDMASIQPRQARDHAARLAERGIGHLDAPVSGGTLGAEAGNLAIMVGGPAAHFDAAQPLFAPLGRATHVGPSGTGQLAKLANQMIVGVSIGAVAEALLLCTKGGADPAKVCAALAGGFADSRVLQLHGQRMLTRDFAPRGTLQVQLKDMRNALSTAEEVGFDAPITALLERLYADGAAHGLGTLDHSGLFLELASRNAMP